MISLYNLRTTKVTIYSIKSAEKFKKPEPTVSHEESLLNSDRQARTSRANRPLVLLKTQSTSVHPHRLQHTCGSHCEHRSLRLRLGLYDNLIERCREEFGENLRMIVEWGKRSRRGESWRFVFYRIFEKKNSHVPFVGVSKYNCWMLALSNSLLASKSAYNCRCS